MDPREGSPTPPGPHGPPGQGLVNNEIMSHLDQLILSKLACLEDRMTSTQKSIADSQLSKMKEDMLSNDNYVFKRKSCEDQFKFNVKLSSKLRDAEDAVKSGDAGLATGKISEGLDLISNRQKVIRLADSSELGWSVVKEYQSNPLASDSEDKKRMMRAEARASRKMKQRRFERSRRMQRFQPFPQGYQSTSATATSGQFQQGTNIPTVNSVRSGRGRRPGLCYGCGKSGHWKFECLSAETVTKPGDKISINFECQSSENKTIYENALRAITPFEASNCLSVVFDNAKNSAGISSERITPVNRLRDRIDVLDQMQVDRYIRDIIMNGYKLPFKDLPPSYALNNNRSARDNPSFVDKEIAELLKLKCISKVAEKPSVVNPLTVAYGKSGKARLVLDCRHINPHLMKFKHKYEDTSVARNLFKDHEFLFTYDLQSAYHIISIFDIHRTYLGFSWRGLCYVFNVLCFGLSTAGFIFSKLMRCPVKYFRSQGHKVVMFLDDGMGGHAEREKAVLLSEHVHKTLINLGFLISEDKCEWEPKQSATWLGHFWEMVGNKIHIAEKRILRLENAIDSLLFQMQTEKVWIVPVRFLASVVGQIVSLQQVFEGLICMTVTSAFYGIKWAHHMNGLSDPTENSFVRNILESAKRTAKAPCRKKDAVTSDHIIQLCDNFIDSQDLCTVRNLCMITLAYAGFLRFDELSSIRCKDLTFCDNYVDISIPKSKTDQYRHGCNILISKGSTSACPVDMLKRYINLANLNIRSDSLLFKAVNKSKSGSKLISIKN